MKAFFKQGFDKLKAELGDDQMTSQQVSPPTTQDIMRYRYQHGTNLGGSKLFIHHYHTGELTWLVFVLEQWLYPDMHDEGAPSPSEIDAIVTSLNVRGEEATRAKWEAHWSNALSDKTLNWLETTAHCNHIRLPIGYWTLGPDFCKNTPFARNPSQVYVNAWSSAKSIISRCYTHGIGVLIDLHAGPGGFGHEAHSGSTNGKAEFWNNSSNRNLATRCLTFMAQEVASNPQLGGVVGIQICNEAIWDAPGLYDWYAEINEIVTGIDNKIPLYLSDGWDMPRALKFTRAFNTVEKNDPVKCPMIVDNHRYYTFDEKDTSRTPEELTSQAWNDLWELDDSLVGNVFDHKAAVAVYIGEYSMALAPQTWGRAPQERHEQLKRDFGFAQSRRWQDRGMGSAFWTLRADWNDGGDWGFKEQANQGNLFPPKQVGMSEGDIRGVLVDADARRGDLLGQAMKAHTDFWDRTAPGGQFEHWRFADAWGLGWNDARCFFAGRVGHVVPCKGRKVAVTGEGGHEVGGECYEPSPNTSFTPAGVEAGGQGNVGTDKIGALDLWVLRRMRESGVARREKCAFGWEWEQGFRKGVRAFEEMVGIT